MRVEDMITLTRTMAENRVRENERREKPSLVGAIVRITMRHGRVVINKDAWLSPGRVVVCDTDGTVFTHPEDHEAVEALVTKVQSAMSGGAK